MRATFSPAEAKDIAIAEIKKEIENGKLPTVAVRRVADRHGIEKQKLSDLYFGTKSS